MFFAFPSIYWKSRPSNKGESSSSLVHEESSEVTKAETSSKTGDVKCNEKGDEEVSDNKNDKQSSNGTEDGSANETESTTADDQDEASGDVDNNEKGDEEVSDNKNDKHSSNRTDDSSANETESTGTANDQDGASDDDDDTHTHKDNSEDKQANVDIGKQGSKCQESKSMDIDTPIAPDKKTLLAFDETVARLTGRELREGKIVKFEEVISQTEKKLNCRLPEHFKQPLLIRKRQLQRSPTDSTWGVTKKVTLETDTVRWRKKEREGITYQIGFTERGQDGIATAASRDEARELAQLDAKQQIDAFVEDQLNLLMRLSKKKPADLSEEKSEEKIWWPMGVLPKPTALGHTNMMLFSGDVFTGYGEGGFEANCEEAPHHVREVLPQTNCLSVHCWAKAFTKSLNDPEAGGAKTFLAQHAMKLANTRSVYRCLFKFREIADDETFNMELNCYTSQYLAAVQVLGDLSSIDTSELAGKRQNQAVALRDSLPPDSQPDKMLQCAVYNPMQVLGQSEEEILPAILPTDEARKAYDFSGPPPKAPNLRDNTMEMEQARRTFEGMQHQSRKHNNRPRIHPLCAVGKGKTQKELWRIHIDNRRAGKCLCWDYSFYYPEKNGKALMDVMYADMKLNPTKNCDELSALAYKSQRRKYIRAMRKNNPQQKKPTVSNQQKRKQVQKGPPKKAKKARTVKRLEEKSMDNALWLPPTKSDTGDYTRGGAQWVRNARESLLLLQKIAGDVGIALNETDRDVPVGYSQVEVRSEIFSGTTLVNTILTDFDTIEEGALEKLFHLDCRKFICALGLVDHKEFTDNGKACKPQQFKESICTWMYPNQLQDLSWQSALVAKFFRDEKLYLKLRRNNYTAKAKDIIRRVKVAIKSTS